MNRQQCSQFLRTPGQIALACGLVGCLGFGFCTTILGANKNLPPVTVGAGSAAIALSVSLSLGAYAGAKLNQDNQNSYYEVALPPSPPPAPIAPTSLPSQGYQPTGQGKLFYIEPVAGFAPAIPEEPKYSEVPGYLEEEPDLGELNSSSDPWFPSQEAEKVSDLGLDLNITHDFAMWGTR
jgi:hypothetical protein